MNIKKYLADLTINNNVKIANDLTVTGIAYASEFKKIGGAPATNLVDSFTDNWSQLGNDLDGLEGDRAGSSVALSSDGTILAIGAYGHENYKGTVRVYKWYGSSWNMIGTEGELDGLVGDLAGRSVALSSDGTIVAVGAYSHERMMNFK